jgi:sulfur carrier protein ThiS
MNVTVHLHTILQRGSPERPINRLELELPPGSDLAGLLRELDIEMNPESLLLVVNGRVAEADRQLEEGDEVNLMPAIAGGATWT